VGRPNPEAISESTRPAALAVRFDAQGAELAVRAQLKKEQ
jgi:hypothetical protein